MTTNKVVFESVVDLLVDAEDTSFLSAPPELSNAEAVVWALGLHSFREQVKELFEV